MSLDGYVGGGELVQVYTLTHLEYSTITIKASNRIETTHNSLTCGIHVWHIIAEEPFV